MIRKKQYCVYINTNSHHTVLYTGVSGGLRNRIFEHKLKLRPGFTSQYNAHKLVYYEIFDNPQAAIMREKQIKGGSRKKKIALIQQMNPEWRDLTVDLL